jgi:hypothetical protein
VRGEATRDPERIRRFEQEARAAGALNHPTCAPSSTLAPTRTRPSW